MREKKTKSCYSSSMGELKSLPAPNSSRPAFGPEPAKKFTSSVNVSTMTQGAI